MVEVRPVARTVAAILPRRGEMDALAAALRRSFGLKLPDVGAWEASAGLILVRTAPHQALALREGAEGDLFDELDTALGPHAGVIDLSCARSAIRLAGSGARDALTRFLPLDLHPRAMRAGHAASTVAAHLSVLVLQLDEAPSYELLCQRSFEAAFLRAFDQTCKPL